MQKTHVAVLMGGTSSEHDVSLNSGAMAASALIQGGHEVTSIVIGKDGRWEFAGGPCLPLHDAVPRLAQPAPDCVFIALHGPGGEDGRLQGMFDLLRIPYIGSGCAASALSMDKIRSKAVAARHGIAVAEDIVLSRADWRADPGAVVERVREVLGFPCVIKSPCEGSSLGMAIPKDADAFRAAMPEVLRFGDTVMVERFLAGTEVTCSVLDVDEGQAPRALAVTEICPVTSEFFDYHAKYVPGACQEITPARISGTATRNVMDMAVRVHRILGCRGLSRSDMILKGGNPVWLEVNTIPGMTQTSLFPQAAASVGITFPNLVAMLVKEAMGRNAAG